VDPLRIDLAPECLRDADTRSRAYAESILDAMERSKPLPVPTLPWQFQVHKALGEAMKLRIKAFLSEGSNMPDDRIGRLVKAYLSDTSLDGTFHDYLRHGVVGPSRYGYGWVAQLTHELVPQMQGAQLNLIGRLWLKAYRSACRSGISMPGDTLGGMPM